MYFDPHIHALYIARVGFRQILRTTGGQYRGQGWHAVLFPAKCNFDVILMFSFEIERTAAVRRGRG